MKAGDAFRGMRVVVNETGSGKVEHGMDQRGKKLGQIFVNLGVLDGDQEKAALEYSSKFGVPFGRACVKMGFLDEQTVVQALSMQLGIPSVSLANVNVPQDVVALVPAELAELHRLVPVALTGGGKGVLVVAMSSPKNLAIVDEIGFRTGRRISPVIAPDTEIEAALLKYYGVDVHRHTKASSMVELDGFDGESLELGDVVVHDRQKLADDFLPTVEIKR